MSRDTLAADRDEEAKVPRRKNDGLPEGISPRHRKGCALTGRPEWACGCEPGYQAQVWSARDRKRLSKTFRGRGALAAAKRWRRDASSAIDAGVLAPGGGQTVRAAGEALLVAMRAGVARTRSGRRYKPSAIRSYENNLVLHIYPTLGAHRLVDVRRGDVQRLANKLLADGKDPSTVRNALMPLRVIYRRALTLEDVQANPTTNLELPAVEGVRDRVATAKEATRLLDVLEEADRGLWATAFYAGLRRGELVALHISDVDLDANVIHVRRGWDPREGEIDLKSNAGRRDVPITKVLRRYLLEHLMRTPWRDGYIFGAASTRPFWIDTPQKRAARQWADWNGHEDRKDAPDAKVKPIGLHEARHTFASLMIASMADAGKFNAKVLQELMGHASITETFDRYGHLFPGTKDEAAQLLDAYLERKAASDA